MSRSKAVRSGFQAVFGQPLLLASELAWRWTFLAAAAIVIVYAGLMYLQSLPVSDRDLFGLSGFLPGTIAPALKHIFSGSGPRLVKAALVVATGLAVLWWMASSLARTAALRALFPRQRARLAPTLVLQGLRMAFAVAVVLAYMGAWILAARLARTGTNLYSPERLYLVAITLIVIAGAAWSVLNWHLSLAPLVAARQGSGVLPSLAGAAAISRDQRLQFMWVGFVFGALRLLLAIAGFFVLLMVLSVVLSVPSLMAVLVLAFVVLLYSGFAALLYVLKLAACVRVVDYDYELRP